MLQRSVVWGASLVLGLGIAGCGSQKSASASQQPSPASATKSVSHVTLASSSSPSRQVARQLTVTVPSSQHVPVADTNALQSEVKQLNVLLQQLQNP